MKFYFLIPFVFSAPSRYRCGRMDLAHRLAQDEMKANLRDDDRKAVGLLADTFDWLSRNSTEPLQDDLWSRLVKYFHQIEMDPHRNNTNPYKLCLFLVLSKKPPQQNQHVMSYLYEHVLVTLEDHLWLQLHLVHMDQKPHWDAHIATQTLAQLQDDTVALEQQLNPNGRTPLKYFKVLIATLQFERAINYLLASPEHFLFAVRRYLLETHIHTLCLSFLLVQ